MSLTRQTQKVFGSNANANQLAVFGSMKTGTPVYSTNLATLQSSAYTQGWSEALLNDKAPYMEEMNAVQYGLSYQIAYMLQEGAFAYDANTTYSNTSIVKAFENGKMYFYHSLVDNNIGHALSDTTYWEKISISDVRNIGEIVTSTIPLVDSGLHLLDGSLLQYGSYKAFIDYIAGLYTDNPTANYFCSKAEWQQSVTTYGVCGKFVYDSINKTVRLPKITGFVEGASGVTSLGDLTEAGLPNHLHTLISTQNYNGNSDHGYSDGYVAGITNSGWVSGNTSTTNASESNSIYGNSSTVQPQTIKVLYYIVIATSTKTDIQVDIDEIATDLNGKADTDLSNVPNAKGILIESFVDGTSWYRIYSDGWCEQGGLTTAFSPGVGNPVAFIKAMYNTDYNISITPIGTYTPSGEANDCISSKTSTGFSIWSGHAQAQNFSWAVKGKLGSNS